MSRTLNIGAHGHDPEVLDAAMLEDSIGKPWTISEPREETCADCGELVIRRSARIPPGYADAFDNSLARALLLSGWDGESGCASIHPRNVAEAARLLAEGFRPWP